MNIEELIRQAKSALESEIETVREKPSTEILFNGEFVNSGVGEYADYSFECHQPSIRFAEEIKATIGDKFWMVHPVSYEEKTVVLRFPEKVGLSIDKVDLEWENDFVLKRTLSEIENLTETKKEAEKKLERLFNPIEEPFG